MLAETVIQYHIEWPAPWQIMMWVIASLAIWDFTKWVQQRYLEGRRNAETKKRH